jgi:hypothetical protein
MAGDGAIVAWGVGTLLVSFKPRDAWWFHPVRVSNACSLGDGIPFGGDPTGVGGGCVDGQGDSASCLLAAGAIGCSRRAAGKLPPG